MYIFLTKEKSQFSELMIGQVSSFVYKHGKDFVCVYVCMPVCVCVYACVCMCVCLCVYVCVYVHTRMYAYCIHGLFGSAFNLAVWRYFVHLPNLK